MSTNPQVVAEPKSDWADTLPEQLIQSLRRDLRRCQVVDSNAGALSNAQILLRSYLLAATLRDRFDDQYIGILLPTSSAGVVTALAVMLADRVPVFLNFTASTSAIEFARDQCQMRRIVSSRRFLDKIGFHDREAVIYLEDLAAGAGWRAKVRAMMDTYLLPAAAARKRYCPQYAADGQRVATVLYSSGSTGIPKGIMLSHGNLHANLQSVLHALGFTKQDVMLGALPFFHSFGFMGNFLLPLYGAMKAVLHANPTEAAAIGELVQRHRCTVLFGAPTFLQMYARKCTREQFESLRLVVAGAEKLPAAVIERFRSAFGITLIEGYGCTELSPVVSVNIPENLQVARTQCGKPGSVGKPILGVRVKTVDPETFVELGVDQEGLVLVGGPNVMIGYLGEPERSRAAIRDGWYVTGDLGKIDGDGYLFITGRTSRFSKIGGEMVPHGEIEDAIQRLLGGPELKAVVTAVPDPVKGERIVVLHLPMALAADDVVKGLLESDLPKLWVPKAKEFYPIEAIPVLGSGKLNLHRIKEIALQHAAHGDTRTS